MPASRPPLVLHLHLPKTGGTTLNEILARPCAPGEYVALGPDVHGAIENLRSWSDERRAEVRVVQGHLPYGLHEIFPQPHTYVTLLREPVDRVLSFYFYVARSEGHYLNVRLREGVTI